MFEVEYFCAFLLIRLSLAISWIVSKTREMLLENIYRLWIIEKSHELIFHYQILSFHSFLRPVFRFQHVRESRRRRRRCFLKHPLLSCFSNYSRNSDFNWWRLRSPPRIFHFVIMKYSFAIRRKFIKIKYFGKRLLSFLSSAVKTSEVRSRFDSPSAACLSSAARCVLGKSHFNAVSSCSWQKQTQFLGGPIMALRILTSYFSCRLLWFSGSDHVMIFANEKRELFCSLLLFAARHVSWACEEQKNTLRKF